MKNEFMVGFNGEYKEGLSIKEVIIILYRHYTFRFEYEVEEDMFIVYRNNYPVCKLDYFENTLNPIGKYVSYKFENNGLYFICSQ